MDTEKELILIVDDDPRITRLVGQYLRQEGYQTETATNGREMRNRIAARQPDLVILDLGMPGEDGLTLTREIRTRSNIPIIILTGKGHTVDKVVGLELGADDYITKPFDERELLARMRSVLRRYRPLRSEATSLPKDGSVARFADWTLDLTGHDLTSPTGENVYLTSHEYLLLEALVTHPNRILSRDTLMDIIAGRDWNPLDRSIDVLIAKLRKKLEKDSQQPEIIKTIRGQGYKLTVQVELR
ncbi:MAG: response regulator transcription factor [Candidatus Competibacteraceae bacterium]